VRNPAYSVRISICKVRNPTCTMRISTCTVPNSTYSVRIPAFSAQIPNLRREIVIFAL
jgi:hypothetical protein